MLRRIILVASLAVAGGLAAAGCGSSSSNNGGPINSTPTISNLNGETIPAAIVGQPIEINGTNFGSSPGTVSFSQGANVENVTPVASGAWTNGNILVSVPTTLTSPGVALVTVTLAGATPTPVVSSSIGQVTSGTSATVASGSSTSAPIALNLVAITPVNPATTTWTQTAPLPTPLRAESAVAIRGATPLVYVIGGNTGNIGSIASNTATDNSNLVYVGAADAFSTITSWTAAASLPAPVAFAAAAEADPTNSLVPIGQGYVYVVGGQQQDSVEPNPTSTIYVGGVTLTTGQITWSTSITSLPEARLGAQALVNRGFLIVTGGTGAQGVPIAATAVAPINPNGSLGTFTESVPISNLPTPVSFHQSFAVGPAIYVVGGNTGPSSSPFAETSASATAATFVAGFRNGEVGIWAPTGSLATPREKFVLLNALGQIFVYEGVTNGNVGAEGEVSNVNPDGSLSPFLPLAGPTVPGLSVFNAAGVVNSVLTPSNTPTFLILGGDSLENPGAPSASVAKGQPLAATSAP
jgi:hypothetical protein